MKLLVEYTTGTNTFSPSVDKMVIDESQRDYMIEVLRYAIHDGEETIKENYFQIQGGRKYITVATITPFDENESDIMVAIKYYEKNKETN
jgi:hypothetical protein